MAWFNSECEGVMYLVVTLIPRVMLSLESKRTTSGLKEQDRVDQLHELVLDCMASRELFGGGLHCQFLTNVSFQFKPLVCYRWVIVHG